MLLLRIAVVHLVCLSVRCRTFKLAILVPFTGSWRIGRRSVGAIPLAMDKINTDPTLTALRDAGHNFTYVWMDTACKPSVGVTALIKAWSTDSPFDVIIGDACGEVCEAVGYLAASWGIPMISYGCRSERLSNKAVYPTFIRTSAPHSRLADALHAIMSEYGWDHVVTLLPRSTARWYNLASEIEHHLKKKGIYVKSVYVTNENGTIKDGGVLPNGYLKEFIEKALNDAHIFIICGNGYDVSEFMRTAKTLDLLNGRYVFFTVDLHLHSDISTNLYDGILDISYLVPGNSADHVSITRKMQDLSIQSPFNVTLFAEEVDGYAFLLHDAIYLYAVAVNESIAHGKAENNTSAITKRLFRKVFRGIIDEVYIDEQGNGWPGFTINNVRNGSFVPVIDYNSRSRKLTRKGEAIYWPGGGIKAPLGRPDCGWLQEICRQPNYAVEIGVPVFLVFATLISLVMTTLGRRIYRIMKQKNDFKKMVWKINYCDLSFNNIPGYSSKILFGSSLSKGTMSSLRSCLRSSDKSVPSSLSPRSRGPIQVFTKVASYHGNIVAVKLIRKSYIYLSKEITQELNTVRELSHQNINHFIGACVEHNRLCVVMAYCTKGSLQDVLENDNIKLDWVFKVSFISDVVHGMEYLHGSPVKFHGRLKSSNVLVDNRWSCKITDTGFRLFREGERPQSHEDVNVHYQLLWTAPEHLRENDFQSYGSQKGDVYSFAIIMQEILVRGGPYCTCSEEPKEIIEHVRRGEHPRYRPTVNPQNADESIVDLMRICWEEIPAFRPNFTTIKDTIKKVNHGRQTNLVEQMMSMMEKYADHLEELVDARTRQLTEEQKKTEELLCRMLPRSVAEELKNGNTVHPETFAQVTIFFSDIVGFTALAAESSPMEVVDFLNDLYTCFDTVIAGYDVYKVETIGDAYMVVSGLPIRNGNVHAGEACTMALDLLNSTCTFKIRHKPDKQLQLRIGIHSGPVVAGVVGLTMPRYCLFGDTVNYASRMESSGLALRIHVSSECKQILDQLGDYNLQLRGLVQMKGKGSVQTYFLLGKEGFQKPMPSLALAAPVEEHTFK